MLVYRDDSQQPFDSFSVAPGATVERDFELDIYHDGEVAQNVRLRAVVSGQSFGGGQFMAQFDGAPVEAEADENTASVNLNLFGKQFAFTDTDASAFAVSQLTPIFENAIEGVIKETDVEAAALASWDPNGDTTLAEWQAEYLGRFNKLQNELVKSSKGVVSAATMALFNTVKPGVSITLGSKDGGRDALEALREGLPDAFTRGLSAQIGGGAVGDHFDKIFDIKVVPGQVFTADDSVRAWKFIMSNDQQDLLDFIGGYNNRPLFSEISLVNKLRFGENVPVSGHLGINVTNVTFTQANFQPVAGLSIDPGTVVSPGGATIRRWESTVSPETDGSGTLRLNAEIGF